MPSHRAQRLAEAIREVVSTAILFEVADPRVRSVTVLSAELSGDQRHATVHVSIMGTEAEQRKAMQGLESAAGFLQSRVAARLQTRFTPVLSFKRDDSVKKSVEISRMIDEALAADRQRHGDEPAAAPLPTTDASDQAQDQEDDDPDDDDVDQEPVHDS